MLCAAAVAADKRDCLDYSLPSKDAINASLLFDEAHRYIGEGRYGTARVALEALLSRLVHAGSLTLNQAQRASEELESLIDRTLSHRGAGFLYRLPLIGASNRKAWIRPN